MLSIHILYDNYMGGKHQQFQTGEAANTSPHLSMLFKTQNNNVDLLFVDLSVVVFCFFGAVQKRRDVSWTEGLDLNVDIGPTD